MDGVHAIYYCGRGKVTIFPTDLPVGHLAYNGHSRSYDSSFAGVSLRKLLGIDLGQEEWIGFQRGQLPLRSSPFCPQTAPISACSPPQTVHDPPHDLPVASQTEEVQEAIVASSGPLMFAWHPCPAEQQCNF